jgi:hypothetical protein
MGRNELTCHELEGLGLDGLIGIGLRNSTHCDCGEKNPTEKDSTREI